MPVELVIVLAAGVFVVAVLYSSVGHAGASGYIAVMSLLNVSPGVIKPTSLALNVLVASIAAWQFQRAGHFSWRLFWPFAVLAVPFALVGGYVTLPAQAFRVLLGIVLLSSAARFLLGSQRDRPPAEPALSLAIGSGAVIGLLSGLTGTGGGIFLTPLLLFMGWAPAKRAAAVSAFFILMNSIAGLLGNIAGTRQLPVHILPLLLVAALGGIIGSHFGSRRLEPVTIKRLLALALVIAGSKLVFM